MTLQIGRPNGPDFQHPLPRGIYFIVRGAPSLQVGDYSAELDADAAYDTRSKIRGLGWVLREDGATTFREAYADTCGDGHNCAEISAIVCGLARAKAEGVRRVLIRTDSGFATHVLTGQIRVGSTNTIRVKDALMGQLEAFEAVAARWTPARELKQADKLSRMLMRRMSGEPVAHGSTCYFTESRGMANRRSCRPLPDILARLSSTSSVP